MFAARTSRRVHRGLVGVLAMTLMILLAPTAAHAADAVPVPPDVGLTDKGVGSLTAADRDFVIKVRLAGLWEIPAGNMAQEKSDDPRVVEIGKTISQQHVELDKLDRAAAAKLGIALPNVPNSDQQTWLAEMAAANSTTFDQVYIDRLRAAHGKIFPAIANIRASTRNDSVRRLAQQANQFVMTHLTLLESSGLVDYGALPTVPPPAAVGGKVVVDEAMLRAAQGTNLPGINTSVILLVLAAALVAGVISTMRIFRTR
jgi:putative membrane protein